MSVTGAIVVVGFDEHTSLNDEVDTGPVPASGPGPGLNIHYILIGSNFDEKKNMKTRGIGYIRA